MTLARVVAPETLDHLPADDPAARRSRRDLQRVHAAMGTRGITRRAWQALVGPRRAEAPLDILELGAGDGTLLLGVARSLRPAWPHVRLTLLDRLDIVSDATLAGYAALGWTARVEVADVLDWASPHGAFARQGTRWDLITTSLFLHHFEGAALDALLAAVAARTDRFFACEPARGWLALAGSHLVGALGANAVTREDAVLSVRAGFAPGELAALWPGPPGDWQVHDRAAGLFGRRVAAARREAAA